MDYIEYEVSYEVETEDLCRCQTMMGFDYLPIVLQERKRDLDSWNNRINSKS